MTEQDKQLLLKDLCARLPYGVIVHSLGIPHEQKLIGYIPDIEHYNIKPYLRPMSSMTRDESFELGEIMLDLDSSNTITNVIDFYNAHHLDHRSLISKGLALVAPEDMYETE